METFELKNDIKVLYVTAESFPIGIRDAHERLHKRIPFNPKRNYFGVSRPENGGEIVYRAAAEELTAGEAEKYNCETLILKSGKYIYIDVKDFRSDVQKIDKAFKKLLKQPNLDPGGYCIEWYANGNERVKCMIRINS